MIGHNSTLLDSKKCLEKRRAIQLNLSGFVKSSVVNGPGKRAVIWVQGCPLRCKGCFNPDMWSFEPKEVVSVDEIASEILRIPGISGVTFSGGEPFCQAQALATLGELLHTYGLNIVTYTGFTYEELISAKRKEFYALLSVTDLLIDGPYVEELRCNLPWRGSSNQRLIFLSSAIKDNYPLKEQEIEFIIEADGTTTMTGFPMEGDGLPRSFSVLKQSKSKLSHTKGG